MADTIQDACDQLIATAKQSLDTLEDADWEDTCTLKAVMETTLGFHLTTLRMLKALADHVESL